MADVVFIFIIVGIIGGILIKVIPTVRRALGSRPTEVELIPSNDDKPANEVDLNPYLGVISKQFSEELDN